jgi:hypothetical protein
VTAKQKGNYLRHLTRLVAAVSFAVAVTVHAEEPTLGAIKAQGAQRLSKDELTALLAGASLTREVERGDVHINTLKDGSVNANYQSKMRNLNQIKGFGSWKVGDDGKYCIEIKWNRLLEDVSGCRNMYKAGDDYYGAGSEADDAKLYRYKISH